MPNFLTYPSHLKSITPSTYVLQKSSFDLLTMEKEYEKCWIKNCGEYEVLNDGELLIMKNVEIVFHSINDRMPYFVKNNITGNVDVV